MKVRYISKKKLYPSFGAADIDKQIAYVREDIPESIKTFVKTHELYHLKDKTKFWLFREIKANLYAGFFHPIGLLFTIIASLHPDRLRFYLDRFRKGY